MRINKTGSYLKPILVQCALIAIARTMLTCIYHMLSKEENFNHELYLTAVIKEPSVMSSTYQLNQAILLLQQNGYTVNILDSTLSST